MLQRVQTLSTLGERQRSSMADFRWVQVLLLVTLTLQLTVSDLKRVTVGDDATLHCGNIKHASIDCDCVTWLFIGPESRVMVPLFECGKIHRDTEKHRAGRLNMTTECSLVIRETSAEDDGLYLCRQFSRSGQPVDKDFMVKLSVGDESEHGVNPFTAGWRWWFIAVVVALALLVITAAAAVRWRRTKEDKTQKDGSTADPDDDVYYASIRHSGSSAQVRGKDRVTYSTVNVSAGASTELSDLYATVTTTH
ncbi:uncharacterized protein LOC114428946 [Parambassis ranga]|uniref:Uncharacterized protein LOC114428946 n=1 Tax=Parambassis ranga TaxID=210632 RepID=A0A6P7HDG1_9TELE|nr:uncharacterized protein LOC114428946 [Parambassis ranga]